MKNPFIFVLIFAVIAACLYLLVNNNSVSPLVVATENNANIAGSGQNNALANDAEKTDFEKLQEAVSREKQFEEIRRPHREQYGIPTEVFEELPIVPSDFGTMAYMFEIGKWKDLKYFTEAYFKQPEFYPNFKEAGLHWWKFPDASSWGVIGWGAYPADIWVSTFASAEFEARTFWRSGWGIQTYQGINLMPTYPASSVDQNGAVFNTQDPVAVSKYFDVSFDKQVFLLGPTFPKFNIDWARNVIVKVTVKPDTPKGQYVIGIDPALPPENIRTEWLLKYKMMYFDAASSGVTINRPHFRLIITVN